MWNIFHYGVIFYLNEINFKLFITDFFNSTTTKVWIIIHPRWLICICLNIPMIMGEGGSTFRVIDIYYRLIPLCGIKNKKIIVWVQGLVYELHLMSPTPRWGLKEGWMVWDTDKKTNCIQK